MHKTHYFYFKRVSQVYSNLLLSLLWLLLKGRSKLIIYSLFWTICMQHVETGCLGTKKSKMVWIRQFFSFLKSKEWVENIPVWCLDSSRWYLVQPLSWGKRNRDQREKNVICQHSHSSWQITFFFIRRLHNMKHKLKNTKKRRKLSIVLLDTRILLQMYETASKWGCGR